MRADREAGMTLLEVLVSLALASLIFSVILTSVRTGLTSYRGLVSAGSREDMLDRGLAVVAGDISRCRPVVDVATTGYAFAGSARQLTCSLSERPQIGTGFRPMTLSVEGQGKGAVLRRSVDGEGTADLILDADDIFFSYVGADGSHLPQWVDPQRMPSAVELHVASGGQDVAGPLTVTILADAEAECTLGTGPYCRVPSGRLGGSAAE